MENPLNKLNPALIGQSNPYDFYKPQPTVYPQLNQAVSPTVVAQPVVAPSSQNVAPQRQAPVVQNTATVVPPATNPTIADQYKNINVSNYQPPQQAKNSTYLGSDGNTHDSVTGDIVAAGDIGAIDENQVYQNSLQRFQKEIDATNQIYAQKLAQQKQIGLGNLGSSTAISARAGALGSPIGEAQFQNVQKQNQDAESLVMAEQSAAINAILGKARKDGTDEIAAKRAAKNAGVKDYLTFLKDATTRRTDNVNKLAKALIAQGVDIKTIDPTQLAELAKNYGVGTNDITSAYATEKAAGAKLAKEGLPASAQEYEYAKNNGYTGSYNEYQNLDANRKASIARAGSSNSSGLTNYQEANAFNTIVGKYNASPLIQAADRTPVLAATIEKVKANPSDAAQQLNLSYAYIQALDTYQSAVREGELTNLNSIDSKIGAIGNSIEKIKNGQIVRPDVALQIANAAKDLVDTINLAAKNKAKSFESQANVVGIGNQWRQYTGGFSTPYNQQQKTIPADVLSKIKADHPELTEAQIIEQFNNQ